MNSHRPPTGPLLRRVAAIGAALFLVSGVTAVPPDADTNDQTNTLIFAIPQQVASFKTVSCQRAVTSNIIRHVYDQLVIVDPNTGEPAPSMAEDWETSADGLTWTCNVRDDSWF